MSFAIDLTPGSGSKPRAPGLEPDPSFRTLLGEPAWRRLALPIRARFAQKPAPGAALHYSGTMHIVRCSVAGWCFAQLCRLVDTPLAPASGIDIPTRVTLRAEPGGGISWERRYRFAKRASVTCRSIKQVDPQLGLVECVGRGVAMRLEVFERGGALHFVSQDYFWRWRGLRCSLPAWLTPGALHVIHADLGDAFRFSIRIRHVLFGETFYQDGIFSEERS